MSTAGCAGLSDRAIESQHTGSLDFAIRRDARPHQILKDEALFVTGRNTTMGSVPAWYRVTVAMNLRLTEGESAALRLKAAEEGRSMQEVARAAIAQYVSNRPERLRAAIERVRNEDAELLDRLSR